MTEQQQSMLSEIKKKLKFCNLNLHFWTFNTCPGFWDLLYSTIGIVIFRSTLFIAYSFLLSFNNPNILIDKVCNFLCFKKIIIQFGYNRNEEQSQSNVSRFAPM